MATSAANSATSTRVTASNCARDPQGVLGRGGINHLIDVINQVDFVENIDLEDRLGQPMVNLALIRNWGTLDLFVLPGFRERTFPGRRGRYQGPLRISTSSARYESAAQDEHVDFAGRYSNYFGPIDVGVAHFWGTSRDPRFEVERTRGGELVLAPHYDIIHQTSLDVQATLGNWLWKLEGYRRAGFGDETYVAAIGGFEYTFVGVFDSAVDVGALAEYHFDERGRRTPTPFNHDLFLGTRVALNDAADSQLLGGIITDLHGNGNLLNIEASRRLGEVWRVELELRLFLGVAPNDGLAPFARDDVIQLEILRYFEGPPLSLPYDLAPHDTAVARADYDAIETRYRAVIEAAVEGIVIIDERGTIETFNPAAERIFGYSAREVTGRNVNVLMPEPDAGRHDGYMRRYLDGGDPHIIGIGRLVWGRRKAGEYSPRTRRGRTRYA